MADITITNASQLMSSFVRIDAEFFKPVYVEASRQVNAIPNIERLGRICEKVTQGSNPVFTDNQGLPCVNGKNVYFGTMTEGEPNYVSPVEFNRLSGFALRRNDLVITLKHATKVGRVWIVEDDERRIFSRNVGLIRLRDDSPIRHSILLLYLWSKHGQLLIDRCATGGTTGQITLPMSELKVLPVPPIKECDQARIDAMFWQSRRASREAINSYKVAHDLFESQLELSKLSFEKSVGYASRFSTVGLGQAVAANRIDAQCFSPSALVYERLLRQQTRAEFLACVVDPMMKGRQHDDVVNGRTDYCSIKNIFARELTDASRCNPRLGTPFANKDDLLLAITGATIGKVGIVKRYNRLAFSGDLLQLRARTDVNPHYLLLVLDHVVGQVQFNRWITGSTNGHLSPRDVGRVLVPRLRKNVEDRIGELVEESFSHRLEAERLLNDAKCSVEQLIEKAVIQ